MSSLKISLCSSLLKAHFGKAVQDIGTYLMKQPSKRPLIMIQKNIQLLKSQIKIGLRLLLAHDLAETSVSTRGVIEYGVESDKVLKLLCQPLYIDYVKEKFGNIAEMIFLKINEHGKMTIQQIIMETADSLQMHKGNNEELRKKFVIKVKDVFTNLVQARLLCRTAQINKEAKQVPDLSVRGSQLFHIPELNLQSLMTDASEEPLLKKKKVNETEVADNVYWGINHEMFQIHFRNRAIIAAAAASIDEKASEIVKTVFELSEKTTHHVSSTTSNVGIYQMLQALKKSTSLNEQHLKMYLSILTNPEEMFMSKADDMSGGMYVVNTSEILGKLVAENAASVVQNRFGSKYSRIFRLVLKNKYLEQKQIEELSMIPPKDAKEHTYQMMKEKFIVTQEISKTPDYAPSRTIFLFHVNIMQVSRMLLQRYYQAALNMLVLHDSQVKEHRRVLDKKIRINAIVATMKQAGEMDQVEEVQQMITLSEQATLDKVQSTCNTLIKGLNELTEMILLFEAYLLCCVK